MILPHANLKLVLCYYGKVFHKNIFEGFIGCYTSPVLAKIWVKPGFVYLYIAYHNVPSH